MPNLRMENNAYEASEWNGNLTATKFTNNFHWNLYSENISYKIMGF